MDNKSGIDVRKKKKRNRRLILLLFFIWLIWGNNDVSVTTYTYGNKKIPKSFNGYRIVHISDLHNKAFGKNQKRLLKEIAAQEPDLIVITGDLIDSTNTDIGKAMDFIRGAVELADVYFISGNNDIDASEYDALKAGMEKAGVVILENETAEIENESGDIIRLTGLAYSMHYEGVLEDMADVLKDDIFDMLMVHQPEFLETYAESGTDLVFTGHAHGGQIRLPMIGGLVAPGQGFFPKYTSGLYRMEETTMLVSRGLGNSILPLRICNRPEVVTLVLRTP